VGHWEVAFVVGFILLFSVWASFPTAEGEFFTIDSSGHKHYILTPEISNDNNLFDDITNLTFLRYDDPWHNSPWMGITDVLKIFNSEQSSTNNNPISLVLGDPTSQNIIKEYNLSNLSLLLEKNTFDLVINNLQLTTKYFENFDSFFDINNHPSLIPIFHFLFHSRQLLHH